MGDAVTAKPSEMSLDSIGLIKMGIVFLLIGNVRWQIVNGRGAGHMRNTMAPDGRR